LPCSLRSAQLGLAEYHHHLMTMQWNRTVLGQRKHCNTNKVDLSLLTYPFGSVLEQVSFVWVFLQESITGRGMLDGIAHGDQASLVSLGLFCMLIGALAVSFLVAPPTNQKPTPPRKLKKPRRDGWSDRTAFHRAKKVAKLLKDPASDDEEILLNFNDGRSPFGLKKNAEVWNGRIAMVRP